MVYFLTSKTSLATGASLKVGGNLSLYRKQNQYTKLEGTSLQSATTGGNLTSLITKGIELIKDNPTLISSVVNTGKNIFDATSAVKEASDKMKEFNKYKSIKDNLKIKQVEKNNNLHNLNDSELDAIGTLQKSGNGFVKF